MERESGEALVLRPVGTDGSGSGSEGYNRYVGLVCERDRESVCIVCAHNKQRRQRGDRMN